MTYELRPLSFGELLDMAFRLFRNHFGLLFALAGIVYVPLALVQVGIKTSLAVTPGAAPTGVVFAVPLIVISLTGPIATAASMHAIGELYLGRAAALGPSLRAVLPILLPLIGTSLLSGLLVVCASLLLVAPGIYLWFAYMLVLQVMVVEGLFGIQALRRSATLMKGAKLRGCGVMVVDLLGMFVPTSLLSLALHAYPNAALLASVSAQAVGFTFAQPLKAVLYFDIRCRKEAFDLEHLADLVEQRAAVPAPA